MLEIKSLNASDLPNSFSKTSKFQLPGQDENLGQLLWSTS